jgi:3-deoxy-D-manno-octulosonate 8-phosphate phosphatase (KDO 8-P phosphatase)
MDRLVEKAKPIKLLILDVDGILSTGALYYDKTGETFKPFHVHDGLGIKLLQRAGIEVAIISAKKSDALVMRLKDLKLEHTYLGYEDKLPAYNELKSKLGLTDQQIAYMGDDLPDLPLLKRAGFAATAANGTEIVKQHVDFTATHKGGKGAVRELCELLLKAQNMYDSVVESYLCRVD